MDQCQKSQSGDSATMPVDVPFVPFFTSWSWINLRAPWEVSADVTNGSFVPSLFNAPAMLSDHHLPSGRLIWGGCEPRLVENFTIRTAGSVLGIISQLKYYQTRYGKATYRLFRSAFDSSFLDSLFRLLGDHRDRSRNIVGTFSLPRPQTECVQI